MPLAIDPKLEARIREYAEAEGLAPEVYIEHLVEADQSAMDELEALALEGLHSGEPIKPGPGYWEEKRQRLHVRLNTGAR